MNKKQTSRKIRYIKTAEVYKVDLFNKTCIMLKMGDPVKPYF